MLPGMGGMGGGPDALVRLEAFKLTIRAGELSGGRTVTTYESTLKRSLVPDDVAKWNKIYPAYIDKSLKRSEGRRISKEAAAEVSGRVVGRATPARVLTPLPLSTNDHAPARPPRTRLSVPCTEFAKNWEPRR